MNGIAAWYLNVDNFDWKCNENQPMNSKLIISSINNEIQGSKVTSQVEKDERTYLKVDPDGELILDGIKFYSRGRSDYETLSTIVQIYQVKPTSSN